MAFKYEVKYNHKIELGGKLIKFKPWTTKNEKDYLIAVSTSSGKAVPEDILYDILIKPCLENNDIDLDVNEQKMLLIEIRKVSIGSTFPIRFQCKECTNVNELEIELDDVINFTPGTLGEVTVDDLYINFGKPNNIARERIEKADSEIERNFVNMIIHIKEIEYQGEVNDTFTFDELYEFFESMPTNVFDEVFNKFLKMDSNLELKGEFICGVCAHKHKIEFDKIPNFLWI